MFIHGVGTQEKTFAHDARRLLRAALAARGVKCHFESVHWAPLADRVENAFMRDVKDRGSSGGPAQQLAVKTLADALMYARNVALQRDIFRCITDAKLRFGSHPYCVFAHSLGGLIATDYLRSMGDCAGIKLVTLGCNIGLFNLGMSFNAIPGLTDWTNFYDDDDVLGFPLAGDPSLRFVRDKTVSVGATGLAHIRYWGDRPLWSETVPRAMFG